MLHSIIWYVHFVVTLIFKTPAMLTLKNSKDKLPPDVYRKKVYAVAGKWAKAQAKRSGARFHIKGAENIPDGTVLYVSNHQSDFDIAMFLCYQPKPVGFVAKAEMLKAPLLRTWMQNMECVFIDRSDIKKSAKAIADAVNILKSGHSMVVFPEGTRSKSREMGEFKPGSFKLATKSNVPIVPVTMNDTYKIMEANNYKIKPADVYITIHPPVVTKGLTAEESAALPEKIKNIIASAL